MKKTIEIPEGYEARIEGNKVILEPKESEDERIRKELLNAFQESEDSLHMVLTPNKRESFIAWLEKQGEQDPVWSDEDEEMLRRCISATFDHGYLKECDWLKSLKERFTWKPSDEQIKGIECAIKTLQHQLNVGDKRLNSLYNDLKKLKG